MAGRGTRFFSDSSSEPTNIMESSVSDIWQPATLCLKLFVWEKPRLTYRRLDTGKIVGHGSAFPLYCDVLQGCIPGVKPSPHEGRCHSICCCNKSQALWDYKTSLGLGTLRCPKYSSSGRICLTTSSAVIHCWNTGVVSRCGRRGVFYNLLITKLWW